MQVALRGRRCRAFLARTTGNGVGSVQVPLGPELVAPPARYARAFEALAPFKLCIGAQDSEPGANAI